MATIDETQAQLNTHEQVCAFRYESICARMKRLENIGMTATGTIIMLLIGILVSILIKGTP
jgi:cytochrome bd-type quinol oxidase subunit 2